MKRFDELHISVTGVVKVRLSDKRIKYPGMSRGSVSHSRIMAGRKVEVARNILARKEKLCLKFNFELSLEQHMKRKRREPPLNEFQQAMAILD